MRLMTGILALASGGFLLILEIIALLDPAGTKMADDGDPFGPSPSWQQHAIYLVIIACLLFTGGILLFRKRQPSKHLAVERGVRPLEVTD